MTDHLATGLALIAVGLALFLAAWALPRIIGDDHG